MRETCKKFPGLVVGLGAVTALFASGACVGVEAEEDPEHLVLESRPPSFDIVLAWNLQANEIAFAEDQFFTFKGVRAMSMMHIAMHDALNAIVPRHAQYAYSGSDRAADTTAAMAQAAYAVLVSQYPDQQARLAAEREYWFDRGAQGSAQDRGVAIGNEAAAAILAVREGDGWDFWGEYEFQEGPGEYQNTEGLVGANFILQPGFRYARTFTLASPDQFRPPPPPALTSAAYAAAFNEVKVVGSSDSTVRTADQTGLAIWWMEFTEGSMNRLARQLSEDRKPSLHNAARLFAYLNMTMFDGYVAVWDSKFHYNHWRPWTAIRAADEDGNPDTSPDPDWQNLISFTPPFQDYASAHATVCSTSLEAMRNILGDRSFTMESASAPEGMPTRSFGSFRAAADECGASRVYLGWHFRYASVAGVNLGRDLAQNARANFLD
jgi:hypothetical protein